MQTVVLLAPLYSISIYSMDFFAAVEAGNVERVQEFIATDRGIVDQQGCPSTTAVA